MPGGGGGGIVSSVSNFIKNDFSDLAGSESIVNSYSSLLTNFNSTISNGEYSSLSLELLDLMLRIFQKQILC